jgi:alpha-tubulin suppressor-like RCC1 family protein
VAIDGGMVRCWGYNGSRQLGHGAQGDQTHPVDVQGLVDIVDVAAGYSHTCALRRDGQVFCWGSANRGQLGRGERTHAPTPQPIDGTLDSLSPPPSTIATFPETEGAPRHVVPHIALGSSHVCTVLTDGRIACFGQGGEGQLGHGSTSPLASDSRVTVPGITDAVEVSSYGSRTCVRRANGQVACWGTRLTNLDTEVGAPSSLPVPVPGIDDAAEIAVGGSMVCVRRSDGTVSCWGENAAGQLGNGTRDSSETPVAVLGLNDVAQLAAGQSTMCARRQNGTVSCWGSEYRGALGSSSNQPALSPIEVQGLRDVTDLSGSSNTFCAVHSRGRLSCWGANDDGQLGNGNSGREADQATPVAIRSLRNVVRVGVGGGTACAVLQDGSARCWGANDFGQTGHNDTETDDVTTPWEVLNAQDEVVRGFEPYSFMGCGVNYCCGLHRDGNLSCQGSTPISGSSGFLGLGNRRSPFPIPVPGLVIREIDETPAETTDAAPTPPPSPDAGAATAPTDASAQPRPPRPVRPRPPGCATVRYLGCRIVYNQFGIPEERCECVPSHCCPGGRRY